jgi:predicted transcriptional regulator
MINILLSVRRPWSDLILDGKKRWELRQNVPRLMKREHVTLWLY